MNDIPRPQYSKYSITDAIVRLEGLRCNVGWGQLNEDLEIAIGCLQYVADIIDAENRDDAFEKLTRDIDNILNAQSMGKG